MIPLRPRILPIWNAKHRQNPVTVRGHGVPVYCNKIVRYHEMELEKWSMMRYNRCQWKGMWFLGCSTLLSILNLHFDIRDSYIFERMSGLQRVEGRCLSADAHLALLGVNYSGNGILGLRKIKKQREIAASFHVTGNSEKFPVTWKGTNVPVMRTRAKI